MSKIRKIKAGAITPFSLVAGKAVSAKDTVAKVYRQNVLEQELKAESKEIEAEQEKAEKAPFKLKVAEKLRQKAEDIEQKATANEDPESPF